MSPSDVLESVIHRLEGVAARLEAFEGNFVVGERRGSHVGGHVTGATGHPPAAAGGASAVLADWDSIVAGALGDLVARAEPLGEDVQKCTGIVADAFHAERNVVEAIASCQKPDVSELQLLLTPLVHHIQAADALTGGRRGPAFNHYKATAEALPALSWVAYSGPSCGLSLPASHVEQAWQSAEFYSNKIMMEFRATEPGHVEWVKAFKNLITSLGTFVKKHYQGGPTWNPSGIPIGNFQPGGGGTPKAQKVAAPAPSAGGRPPPPPPMPPGGPGSLIRDPPASSAPAPSKGGQGMAAVFSHLNKGEAVTAGLKKVTDDMKTKNRSDRSGAVPAVSKPVPLPSSSDKPKPASVGGKAPRLECEQGRKWFVENHVGNTSILLSDTNPKQSVYISNCKDSVVKVEGKVNSIMVDGCQGLGLLFDDLVAVCELVNSQSIQVQVVGVVPTVAVDKVSGLQLFLSEASLGVEVTSAQSCGMNVVLPNLKDPEGDPIELPIPEQFVTRLVNGKLHTEPVQHSAG